MKKAKPEGSFNASTSSSSRDKASEPRVQSKLLIGLLSYKLFTQVP